MVKNEVRRHPIRTTRDRIVETAARLFNSKGYHQTSIVDIAQEAGVAKGSVYYHFPSKDQLLVAIIQEGVRLTQTRIQEVTGDLEEPMERLVLALGAIYDVLVEYQGLARFALLGGCEGVTRGAKEEIDAARDQFEANLEARVRDVVGDAAEASVMARILFGALEGAVRAAGSGRALRGRRSRERVKTTLLAFCSRALAAQAARAGGA